jgi:hypothetical protein
MKKALTTAALAALLGIGGLAVTAASASAAVVCNAEGDCWHTHDTYSYPTGLGVVVHEDNWRWDADHDRDAHVHYRWHEHDGRGYWRNGVWVTF